LRRPEKEEVEMMEAVIPHLRLLTLFLFQLDPLSKYLSDSQMSYLAKRLTFRDDSEPLIGLNPSTLTRSRPESRNFKLEFIAEDLIKDDWEMMGLKLKKDETRKELQICIVANQHLFLKGIEILTRANNATAFEVVANRNKAASSRYIYL